MCGEDHGMLCTTTTLCTLYLDYTFAGFSGPINDFRTESEGNLKVGLHYDYVTGVKSNASRMIVGEQGL